MYTIKVAKGNRKVCIQIRLEDNKLINELI